MGKIAQGVAVGLGVAILITIFDEPAQAQDGGRLGKNIQAETIQAEYLVDREFSPDRFFTKRVVIDSEEKGVIVDTLGRFYDLGDETVYDSRTGNVWEKEIRTPALLTGAPNEFRLSSYEEAERNVRKLNTRKYLGRGNWIIPKQEDFDSIADRNYNSSEKRPQTAAIPNCFMSDIFKTTNQGFVWINRCDKNNCVVGVRRFSLPYARRDGKTEKFGESLYANLWLVSYVIDPHDVQGNSGRVQDLKKKITRIHGKETWRSIVQNDSALRNYDPEKRSSQFHHSGRHLTSSYPAITVELQRQGEIGDRPLVRRMTFSPVSFWMATKS